MEPEEVRAALEHEHSATVAQRAQLGRDLDEILAAAADVATDDEHDPEGATIAYERERTKALIQQADGHLGEVMRALERLEAGDYGNCIRCGREIASERLQARPMVRTCIDCAT